MKQRHIEAVPAAPAHRREHAFTQENLPWLVNGALDAAAARRMNEHAAVCEQCRGDLERERGIAQLMGTTPVVELAPQAGLARLMSRIEARETQRERWSRWLRPLTGGHTQRPLVFTLAIQAVVIVMLAGVVVMKAADDEPPAVYATLSNAAAPVDGVALRVVLDPRLTLGDVRALLAPLDARIVDGPAENGLLTVQVPVDAPGAIHALRAQRGVLLAEIVAD